MLIVVIIIAVVIIIRVKKRNNASNQGSNSHTAAGTSATNTTNTQPQAIRTLSAVASTFSVPNVYEWSNFPSRVIIKDCVTLAELQQLLWSAMQEEQLPVVFSSGRIDFGSSSSKRYENCLIISHTNPPESYYEFAITCRITDNTSFVRIYRTGGSYYTYKINEYRSSKTETDGVLKVMNAIQYATDKPDIQAWEDGYALEEMFYNNVKAVLQKVLGF